MTSRLGPLGLLLSLLSLPLSSASGMEACTMTECSMPDPSPVSEPVPQAAEATPEPEPSATTPDIVSKELGAATYTPPGNAAPPAAAAPAANLGHSEHESATSPRSMPASAAVAPPPPVAPGAPGSLLKPQTFCPREKSQWCYSQDQLDRIAEEIGSKFENLRELAQSVLKNPKGAVQQRDLDDILKYFGKQEKMVEMLQAASGSRWNEIKGKPELIRGVVEKMPREDRQKLRAYKHDLTYIMKDLMSPRDMNVFHQSLHAPKDALTEWIMRKASDSGPVMPPGSWPRREPDNPAAWNHDARESLRSGDAQAAAAQAAKALSLDPRNAEAFSTLAAAQYDLKRYPEASDSASKALALEPTDAQAFAVSKLAHDAVSSGGRLPKPTEELPPSLLASAPPWHHLNLTSAKESEAAAAARDAQRALNGGDFARAQAAAARALAADPHAAYAYGLKAFAEIKQGKAEEALRDAMAGLALDPKDRLAQKARAQALIRMGRYREGLLAARAAQSDDPRSGFAAFLEAEAREGLNDRAGALQALRRAGQLDARYQNIYDAALQAPQEADMAFLFPDLKPKARSGGPAATGRGWAFVGIVSAAVVGGGLLAFGLWQLLAASLAAGVKTIFGRGPAVSGAPEVMLDPEASDSKLLRGQFKTLRQIGVGGMGMVYEGNDVSLDRRVAIKKMREELRLDRRQRERFVTEAKLVAALHHPNVVDIYAIVDEDEELYLIFEFVAGKNLHELIQERGALPYSEALGLFRGVAGALEYAHGRNIIHRDLKPSNIMITDEGVPKVMDFGIARSAKEAMTRYSMTNTVVGTPPYMAPEQEQGVIRRESDVYALGICLYEMLCGQLPFVGSGSGMFMNKVNKSFVPLSKIVPGLPEGLDDIFDRVLEPDPDQRYRSVTELRVALDALRIPAAS